MSTIEGEFKNMKSKISTDELFSKAAVGLGATKHCGSDSYGYYISFIDPARKTIGLYQPKHWFANSWTEGSMKHEDYKPDTPPTMYLQAWRGSWYLLDNATGARRDRYPICIGHCSFYQDPSF